MVFNNSFHICCPLNTSTKYHKHWDMTSCSWASSLRRFETIVVPPSSETCSVTSQKRLDRQHPSLSSRPSLSCFLSLSLYGETIRLAVTVPLHRPAAWAQSQDSLCGIYGGQSVTGYFGHLPMRVTVASMHHRHLSVQGTAVQQ